jgi:hypothetical protein
MKNASTDQLEAYAWGCFERADNDEQTLAWFKAAVECRKVSALNAIGEELNHIVHRLVALRP